MITTEHLSIKLDSIETYNYIPEADEDGEYTDGEQVSSPIDASILTINLSSGDILTIKGSLATETIPQLRENLPDGETN